MRSQKYSLTEEAKKLEELLAQEHGEKEHALQSFWRNRCRQMSARDTSCGE